MDQEFLDALVSDITNAAKSAGVKLASCKVKYEQAILLVTVIIQSEDGRGGAYRAEFDDLLNPTFRRDFVQRVATLGDVRVTYGDQGI